MRWFRSLFYNIRQGIKGIFRNSIMSTASVLVLLSCMIIVGTFYLVTHTLAGDTLVFCNFREG